MVRMYDSGAMYAHPCMNRNNHWQCNRIRDTVVSLAQCSMILSIY